EDGADETDDRGAVGEDADDVGSAADLLVQPLERSVLAPVELRRAQVWGRSMSCSVPIDSAHRPALDAIGFDREARTGASRGRAEAAGFELGEDPALAGDGEQTV